MLTHYISLLRLNKPIGILLLLWPTLWGLWLAGKGHPPITIVFIFIVGVILMRSAGCIINDFADRNIDNQVERTRERPLTTKKISTSAAIFLFGVLILSAFSLTFFLNVFSIELAIIGAALTILYPFLKRITQLPQLGLGCAFAWGIPMAFAAIQNTVPTSAWILFAAAALWPVIYDTFYAMVDRDDDIRIGVKSTAILFGSADCFITGIMQIIFLLIMLSVGKIFQLNFCYSIALIIVAILFSYQQWLIKNRERTYCFQAFLNNHWVGFIIFLGILLST